MKTQPLSIDPNTLDASRRAAEAAGLNWSAYATRAIRHEIMEDNMRRAAALIRQLAPEQTAERDAWRTARATAMAARLSESER
ncbi:MAG: hypothetical protein ABWY93_18685 [Mycobacterium sp.]